MSKRYLKMTALFLGLQMCVGMTPALAGETVPEELTETPAAETETYICDNYAYTLLEDGTAEIVGYLEEQDVSVLPEELDGIPVTAIGPEAFSWNDGLVTVEIPDSVTSIGKDAFYYCSGLTNAVLPANIVNIDNNIFTGCEELASVSVSPVNPYWETIDGVLYSKSDRRLVCYPPEKADTSFEVPEGIEIIEDYAFCFGSNLEGIRFPNSLTGIGAYAFYDCYSLENIEWSDSLRDIGEAAFWCTHLASVTLPESVTSIGDYAFTDCKSLTDITFPDSLENLGEAVFSGCRSLTGIVLPDSIKSMGDNPFRYCESLAEISVSADNPYLESIDGILYCKPEKRLVFCPMDKEGSFPEIPRGITTIDGYAVSFCAITDIVIPDTVTDIKDGAFYGCENMTNIVLPDSVANIGDRAFYNCSALTDIVIPDSVSHIGDSAFTGCDNLTVTASQGGYVQKYCKENYLSFSSN